MDWSVILSRQLVSTSITRYTGTQRCFLQKFDIINRDSSTPDFKRCAKDEQESHRALKREDYSIRASVKPEERCRDYESRVAEYNRETMCIWK